MQWHRRAVVVRSGCRQRIASTSCAWEQCMAMQMATAYPVRFLQRCRDARDIANAEGDGIRVYCLVTAGQRHCIRLQPAEPRVISCKPADMEKLQLSAAAGSATAIDITETSCVCKERTSVPKPRVTARLRPSASMSALMSATITLPCRQRLAQLGALSDHTLEGLHVAI